MRGFHPEASLFVLSREMNRRRSFTLAHRPRRRDDVERGMNDQARP